MVSTNIKISQRTKFIEVVIIVSKILSAILFRTTNLEKPVENSQKSHIPNETPSTAINGWDKLPADIVEKILIQDIKGSDHLSLTYNMIKNSCFGFHIIGKKGEMLLPR